MSRPGRNDADVPRHRQDDAAMTAEANPVRPSGRCAVCRHQERYRIELLLAGGASKRAVAERFQVHPDAAWRHWTHHVAIERKAQIIAGPLKLSELAERANAEGLSLLDYLAAIRATLLSQFQAAAEAGDRFATAALSGRLLEVLREIGRLTGELGKVAGVSIHNHNTLVLNSPIFADVQVTLIRALQPYPEARAAVVGALRDLERRARSTPMIEARAEGVSDAA